MKKIVTIASVHVPNASHHANYQTEEERQQVEQEQNSTLDQIDKSMENGWDLLTVVPEMLDGSTLSWTYYLRFERDDSPRERFLKTVSAMVDTGEIDSRLRQITPGGHDLDDPKAKLTVLWQWDSDIRHELFDRLSKIEGLNQRILALTVLRDSGMKDAALLEKYGISAGAPDVAPRLETELSEATRAREGLHQEVRQMVERLQKLQDVMKTYVNQIRV